MNKNKLSIASGIVISGAFILGLAHVSRQMADKAISLAKITIRLDDVADAVGYGSPDNPVILEYGDYFSAADKVESVQQHFNFPGSPTTIETESVIDTSKVGYQQIEYKMKATDKYKQTAEKSKAVLYYVQDTKAPVIKLSGEEDTIYDDQTFDLDSIVKSVKDPVDGKIKKVKKLKDGESGYTAETDYKKGVSAGDYTYTVKAQDQHGNTAEKSYTIHVKARPVVQAPARNYSSYSGGDSSSSSYSAPEQTPSYSSDRIYIGGYSAYLSSEYDQYHTDLPDTAVYWYYNGMYFCADHAAQGFKAILWNNTGVFMGRPIMKTQKYMGDKREDGHIYLDDGRSYFDVTGADICMYTCVGSRRAVTYWVFC